MTGFTTWCTGRKLFHSFKYKLSHVKYTAFLFFAVIDDSDNTRYKVFVFALVEERNSSYKVHFSLEQAMRAKRGIDVGYDCTVL